MWLHLVYTYLFIIDCETSYSKLILIILNHSFQMESISSFFNRGLRGQRSQTFPYMLSAKQGSTWYHFKNVFGMMRRGSNPRPPTHTAKRRLYHWATAALVTFQATQQELCYRMWQIPLHYFPTGITGYNQRVTGCGSQRRQCSCYSTKTAWSSSSNWIWLRWETYTLKVVFKFNLRIRITLFTWVFVK